MKVRFLLEENLSPRIATQLCAAGIDARSVAESNLTGVDDDVVLAAAVAAGRIVVTYNVADFVVLLQSSIAAGRTPPGLVFVSSATLPSSAVGALVRALTSLEGRLARGELDASGGLFLQAAARS